MGLDRLATVPVFCRLPEWPNDDEEEDGEGDGSRQSAADEDDISRLGAAPFDGIR
jgi:hypothetical protein